MRVRVRYFAALREIAGREAEELELPQGATVTTARELLAERYPGMAPVLARSAAAVNRSYVPAETSLAASDELAFIPPVGGG